MTPLRIGACMALAEVATHRDWLFDDDRDLELQDFIFSDALIQNRESFVATANATLDGFKGRLGVHGPFIGLDMDNADVDVQRAITGKFIGALELAAEIGARQMVLHSPYDLWYKQNRLCYPGYEAAKLKHIHAIMDPVVKRAGELGCTLVIENIKDVDPETRRAMVDSFDSDAIALSIDTGHAHLARNMSGAPPVDYFVRDAGNQLRHVHIQDLDGYADRHWAPGEGEIEWEAVFRALGDCESEPHLVLELRDKGDIQKGFAYLRDLGLAC
ncbi:MAG: sugar phosphate isomerase/epimerase family protein [Paracoccaceae bacterium]